MKQLIYSIALLATCIGCTSDLPENSETGPFLQLLSVEMPENAETKSTVTTQTITEVQTYVTKATAGTNQGTTRILRQPSLRTVTADGQPIPR